MGKKLKVGKARKDKFYQLAKETGYRARSAFKLLQLNRKYEFLQSSRVCIDLCAAPGSWMQVAQRYMPVSSLIIGVDLVSINPIPKCMSFQEDITTVKCRQTIARELKTWKADVVLHDGAPNVGKSWVYDAYQQAILTLQALKLATGFLKKGGWFITKVFRSKDYTSLVWVFKQLFRKVHATKPKASRNESAEIFVVCQGYLAPDNLDPRFTDPRSVFKDVSEVEGAGLFLMHPERSKRKAIGYNDVKLHHELPVREFLAAENFLDLLGECNEVVLDDEVSKHFLTNDELKLNIKDIKVLGKKELRQILSWRLKLNKYFARQQELLNKVDEVEKETDSEEEEEAEQTKIKNQLEEMRFEQNRDQKKAKKKVLKERRKLREKMSLNMILPGDRIDQTDDVDVFNIKHIKNKEDLEDITMAEVGSGEEQEEEEQIDFEIPSKRRKLLMKYNRFAEDNPDLSEDEILDDADLNVASDEEDSELEMQSDDDGENPLMMDLGGKKRIEKKHLDRWFNKDVFEDIDDGGAENMEIQRAIKEYKNRGGQVEDVPDSSADEEEEETEVVSQKKAKKTKQQQAYNSDDSDDDKLSDMTDDESQEDSDYDENEDMTDRLDDKQREALNNATKKVGGAKNGFEIVPVSAGKNTKLDAVELAMGEELIKSSKRKRELLELSFNRYNFDDTHLPDWFMKDEKKHTKKQLPVTKEQINLYKEQQKLINARPIKKITEARARKKMKAVKKLDKIRKKAENINEVNDETTGEKMKKIKDMYKKAGLLSKKKENVTYVVAKRASGKRVSRPPGVKGKFKIVDPRMKKDLGKDKKRKSNKTSKGRKSGKNKERARTHGK